jgi:RecA-family ATPase
LEDDHRRLQGRLYRMFGMDGTNDLLFAIYAKQLGLGLEEQLKKFVREHPDTKLIIIDTLQKVREVGGDKYSYANDYEVVGKLKRLADDCGICLLLVHHTRKQQADDKFDMISGTNGLLGAADGAFLLQKEKRTDGSAILDVAGRDQQDQRMYLTKDRERLVWELERLETEPWVEPPDPVLEAVAALVTADRPAWGGTATELAAALQTDMKPNALAMRLNVRAGRLAAEYHIRYENSRRHAGRSITLTLEPPQA